MRYTASKYNHRVIIENSEEHYLFNCLSGGLIRIPGPLALFLDDLIHYETMILEEIPEQAHAIFKRLVKEGFYVPESFDEFQVIEKRYRSESDSKLLSLTLAPSLDCNLQCYYCYQEHRKSKMSKDVCDKVIDVANRKLSLNRFDSLEIDWYGGEPLLALDAVEYISEKLIEAANAQGVNYRSSMVTNGTLLNEYTVGILSGLHVNNIQVTLDGTPAVHNRNRPFRGGKPSFDIVLKGIKAALEKIDISLRINVDKDTVTEAFGLLDVLEANGCFSGTKKLVPYISMIGPLSTVCKSTALKTIPLRNYYQYVLHFQREVLRRVPNLSPMEVLEYPKVLNRACGAQCEHSLCLTPSGRVYKCGLEIQEPSMGASYIWEDYWNHENYKRWVSIDPLSVTDCRECRFLPLCMGGCAKYNFKEGHFYKGEACLYWNNYLDLILKQIIDLSNTSG